MQNLLELLKIITLSQIIMLSAMSFVCLEFPMILTDAFTNIDRLVYLIISSAVALFLYITISEYTKDNQTKD